MTKKELANVLFERGTFNSKAEAERKLEAVLNIMEETLVAGENINFIGWGKLEVVERAPRIGRNPKTGEEVQIEARKSVKFKAGKTLLGKLN
ncbi:MAG: HU family DNA-binding protein [Fusobacterium sp. JB021]|uniref:HU family DNA-binding protein n=1 Tax=Fusobacterium sp. MFO224 TaxID=3378070 RepID=UPI002775EDFE|nr:HU family DNA-binding protein [Fusobacterium sp. JB020]MDP0493752.1 HU family DNA-binding protein [Fusobacterium sp. JB021]MDP0507236.1 HU family DNA-binding protein [Fusobacterium sp. JB019]